METVHTHSHSGAKIRTSPTSMPEELARGQAIVADELGSDFSLETGLPRNVGVKGDQGVYGETVLLKPADEVALRVLWADCDARPLVAGAAPLRTDRLGRISNRLTNEMTAVTKVLIDITLATTDTPIYDALVRECSTDPVTRATRRKDTV